MVRSNVLLEDTDSEYDSEESSIGCRDIPSVYQGSMLEIPKGKTLMDVILPMKENTPPQGI
jgi:hypothetical protein